MTLKRTGGIGRILLLTLLLELAMATTMVRLLWLQWEEIGRVATQKSREETRDIAARVAQTLDRVDLLLGLFSDRIDLQMRSDERPEVVLNRLLRGDDFGHLLHRLPVSGRLMMFDSQRRALGLSDWPDRISLPADLIALHADRGVSFAISSGTDHGAPSILVSRRLDRGDGSFAGVAVVALDAEEVLAVRDSPDLSLSSVRLIDGDGAVHADWQRVGRGSTADVGLPTSLGPWDLSGLQSIASAAAVPGFALRVVTGLPRGPSIRQWLVLFSWTGGAFLAVTVLVVFGTASVVREVGRRVAAEAELSAANAELHRMIARTEELARLDALTGIANRRSFDDRLQEEMSRTRRTGAPLSLIIIDLDKFKDVNDRHGHTVGDRVLATSASVLRDGLREIDFPARYGGEEFTVILPGTDLDGAFALADRLRQRFDQPHHRLDDGARLKVTASLGVAQCQPGDDAEQFVARADTALYRSKAGGRNRVSLEKAQAA